MRPTHSLTYRGCTITPRTYQIRGRGHWTLDVVIEYRATQRAFSGPTTFPTEQAAIRGCHAFGRRIIDGLEPSCILEGVR